MRFIRLRVANYRGVTTTEVKFAPTGITLVQGPNEVGKTSLAEAIGLLFDFPDSSKHSAVEAIRPVHRDEGPEIELQAETGPYAFTYFKRFHRRPQTQLTITRPKPENHTGREAHDRAEAILRETLDINLWKALTIQQGDAIQQPDLANQTSLSAALDKVAGGRPADPREEGLFDRVREEFSRYYTERGSEKKVLGESRKRQAEVQGEVPGIEQSISDLEQDVERAATLERELTQLRSREEDLAKEVRSHAASLEEIEVLEAALAAARLKLARAEKSDEIVRRDKEVRQELIDEVAKAAKKHSDAQESSGMYLSALDQAEQKLKKAQTAYDDADRKRRKADGLAALGRADFDYYNNKLHLEQLEERKERIDQARQNAIQAEDVLARNKVDSGVLSLIQDAERAFLTANAQLETGAPSVLLRGLAECRLSIDDTEIQLHKGEARTISVADKSKLIIPNALEIEVVAGSSTEGLSRRLEEAQRALEEACTTAGVSDPDEARKAFEERRDAFRHVESKAQVEKENLRDLTYEELLRKLRGLQTSVSDYLAQRPPEPSLCPDFESAKKERARTESAQREASDEWEAAHEALDAARSVREGLNTKHQEARVEVDLLATALEHAQQSLEQARSGMSDDALESNLKETARGLADEEGKVRDAETSLRAKNPERVKALAETAKGSLQTAQNRRSAAHIELTQVETRLNIHGEEGLYEKLHLAEIRLERIAYENQSLFRRAAVAKLLFESMRAERDKARRAYVAPLKEKIEELGRLVFDHTFEVDITDDLQIASRTANGVTVPFHSLSGGTREQLSLIFRLACSLIVAKEGGTPVILDDALGYTDPERLPLMGAVLAKAARECQLVIFTCIPDRYGHVGDATVVAIC